MKKNLYFPFKGDYSSSSMNYFNSNSTPTNVAAKYNNKSYIEFIENDEIKRDCSLYPSCKTLKDGMYPLNDCKSYFQCKDERTISISTCPTSLSNHGDNRHHHKNVQHHQQNDQHYHHSQRHRRPNQQMQQQQHQ